MRKILLAFAVVVVSGLAAQEPTVCPPAADLRRGAEELLTAPPVRDFIGGGRARILRVTCEIRDKSAPRPLGIAYLVSYETGAAAELQFVPGVRDRVELRKLPGRPQSSVEEREEARSVAREALRLEREIILEGGFAVDPPPGSPPGRYLELHVTSPDRREILAEVIVDLTRRTIAGQRKQ